VCEGVLPNMIIFTFERTRSRPPSFYKYILLLLCVFSFLAYRCRQVMLISFAPRSRVKLPDATWQKSPEKVMAQRCCFCCCCCCSCWLLYRRGQTSWFSSVRVMRSVNKKSYIIFYQKIIIAKMHRYICQTWVVLIYNY